MTIVRKFLDWNNKHLNIICIIFLWADWGKITGKTENTLLTSLIYIEYRENVDIKISFVLKPFFFKTDLKTQVNEYSPIVFTPFKKTFM